MLKTRFHRMHTALPVTLLLLVPAAASADPPPGYYDSVNSLTRSGLRSTLHGVIDDHIRFPYTSANTDTWNILELADEDPANPGAILDVYKNASFTKVGGGNSFYNREHTWPNSYGFPDDEPGNYPYTDCHQLFLSDIDYNSDRGNNPFRSCSGACSEDPTVANHGRGGGSGVYPGNSNWFTGSGSTGTWETWSGRRGDVARALLYLDLRYEGGTHGVTGVAEPDLILTDNQALIVTSGGVNASVAYMGMLSTLLAWHREDPVDDLERHRNDTVASFQTNRNPFIDHPEWASCAFTGDCGSFYTLTPCRLIDTRNPDGPYAGPALASETSRLFTLAGQCGIPATAEAVVVNLTAVNPPAEGQMTGYPAGLTPPATNTISFAAGRTRANNAVLPLSSAGVLAVRPFVANGEAVHLVMDVTGYID